MAQPVQWNHDLHYQHLILGAVPIGCQRALDVGCGTGDLTRKLSRLVPEVCGIDSDSLSIDRARSHPRGHDIDYGCGDFLAFPFKPASFDLITAVASLHHMDQAAALARMRNLLRPGGVLAALGCARDGSPGDVLLAGAAVPWNRLLLLAKTGRVQSTGCDAPTLWPRRTVAARCGSSLARCCRGGTTAAICCGATRWSGASQSERARLTLSSPSPWTPIRSHPGDAGGGDDAGREVGVRDEVGQAPLRGCGSYRRQTSRRR
jgi:SAM-dependent methyltransferase